MLTTNIKNTKRADSVRNNLLDKEFSFPKKILKIIEKKA